MAKNEGELDRAIAGILAKKGTVAVVGMSRDPGKAARRVPEFLAANGFRVIPVNPQADEIAGLKCEKDLASVPGELDVVLVFRPSAEAAGIARAAAARKAARGGPRAIWLQEGLKSEEARGIAEEAGLEFVEDRCMMKELGKILDRP